MRFVRETDPLVESGQVDKVVVNESEFESLVSPIPDKDE